MTCRLSLCLGLLLSTVILFQPLSVIAEAVITEGKASTDKRAIVVLDASGSMWGQVDGKTKIEIAREVTGELLSTLDPELELGLVTYGHRRKGDCTDIEALIAPTKGKREQFLKQVNALNPKGKTPISDAVILAAEELSYTENKATVILVSDGIETCAKDPCEVGKKLEKAGVDFTAHVIGFDLKKGEDVSLRCLAEKTGGEFFAAADADGLKNALGTAMEQAAQPVKFNLQLRSKRTEDGPFLDRALTWKIYSKGTENNQPIEEIFGTRPKRWLEPGKYVVEGEFAGLTARKEFELVTDKVNELVLVFASGTVEIKAYGKEGGPEIGEAFTYKIYRKGEQQPLHKAFGARRVRELGVGDYLAEGEYAGITSKAAFSVEVGKVAQVALLFEAGRVDITPIATVGGRGIGRAMNWKLFPKGETTSEPIRKSYGSALRGKFPAGDYIVRAEFAGLTAEVDITVNPGETSRATVLIPAGRVDVSVAKDGKALRKAVNWKLYRKGDEARDPLISSRSQKLVRDLPEGEYVVEAFTEDKQSRGELTVAAGKVSELMLEL